MQAAPRITWHGTVTDDAFCEWLLSDHPAARAERDWLRAAAHTWQRGNAAAVRACPDGAPLHSFVVG